MLSIGKLKMGQEAYYLEEVLDGREDYYLSAGEAPGRWAGSLATRIGLSGEVEADPLRAVLAGHDPTGTYKLSATPATLPGYDLTLSAPKSVSIIWGLGDPATVERVVAAHERAVHEALTYLESAACHVRRGPRGVDQQPGNGLLAATFRHRTSRAGDPDLHTHVLVANMTEGPDGRWTALDGRSLYHHARTAGFVYQARLRHELHHELGLAFGEVVKGCADVIGVPAELCRAMSVRRQQILDAMDEHGTHSARSAQAATLLTRMAKDGAVSESLLRDRWTRQADDLGFDLATLPHDTSVQPFAYDYDVIARRVTDDTATFDRRDLVRALASSAWNGATLDELHRGVDRFLWNHDTIRVREGRWTTREILVLESSTVRTAVHGQRAERGVVDEHSLDHAMDHTLRLGDDQRQAVWALTRRGCAVDVVIGPAGSGKTTMLDVARDAWERSGHRVIGAALAAKAAQQLAEGAHITSTTADRLLSNMRRGRVKLDERTVVVIDEAGMLGTRRLAAIASLTAEAKAKLVLVGDPRQLAEIDAGGLFAGLATRLPTIELTENRRQRDADERAIAAALRIQATGTAIDTMQRAGRITTAPTADAIRDVIVSDWFDLGAARADTLMIAARRATVADLNERAQALLRSSDQLGPEVATFDGTTFAIGDRVVFHQNDYRLDLLNGERGTVLGAGRHHLAVEIDDGRRLNIAESYIDAGNLTLGYAVTVHKAQGTTCNHLLVLGDDTFTIETAYTALTRGRDRNQLYLAQPDLDDGHHGHTVSIDLIDAFTDAISRSSAKVAAIDEVAGRGHGIELD